MQHRRIAVSSVAGLALAFIASSGLLLANSSSETRANQGTSNIKLGCTGGNVRDRSRAFCCSGTLGALVTKNSTQYILSNAHVLALSGRGSVGDDISHPGMIDTGCQILGVVADLSEWALGGCCDAAIAQVRSGAVDSSGTILCIGQPSSATVTAAVGMAVQKVGRTTGHTTGSVTSVNNTISVRYPKSCGSGGGTTVTFNGQIGIGDGTFSAGGDSGSLIVDSSKRGVGLLFAGSSTTTFANPINSVLSTFGVSLVGSGSLVSDPTHQPPYTEEDLAAATAVLERNSERILRKPLVLGHGVGLNENDELVLKIYVERFIGLNHRVMFFEGYPVEFVNLGGPIYFLTHEVERAK